MSHCVSAGLRLRKLMDKSCVCLPGAFSGMIGRLAADVGFQGCYVSGAAVSATCGLPDIGLLPMSSFTQVIKDISTHAGLPVLADADTGFGEIEMIHKTVHEYFSAGAAGLHIEDQVNPKRCGHLDGKQLVKIEDMCEKIKRAVKASDTFSNGEFIICARTDARGVEGMAKAVERASKYVEAGAHMIFPEGLQNVDEFKQFAEEMKKLKGEAPRGGPYMLANMTEFGKTPNIPVSTFEEAGYHAVIFPVSTLRIALKAVNNMLINLKEKGTVENIIDDMYTRNELYKTLRYTPGKEWTYPSPSSSSSSSK